MTRTTRLNLQYEPFDTGQPWHIFNELVQYLEGGLLLQWSGDWSAGTYYKGDIVLHEQYLYVANTETTNEPSLPTAATDWDFLAFAGTATPYTAITGTYTVLISDYTINATSGTFDLTLPTAV